MASTYSTSLRLELMATGEKSETWGAVANSGVFELIEDALATETTITSTGGTVTLTASNGAADQARSVFLDVDGLLVSNLEIVAPAVPKFYFIRNGTTGAFTVTLKNSGGTGLTITQGATALVFLDGSVAILIGQESYTVTSFIKTLLDDVDAVTARATLGLSTFADTNAVNTFQADQKIRSADGSAAEGPGLDLIRDSASPAVSDLLGVLRLKGDDSVGNETTYSKIGGMIVDPTDGSEDGALIVDTVVAGTLGRRANIAAGLWMQGATGGDPGTGKINATAVQVNGTPIGVWSNSGLINLTTGSPVLVVLGSSLSGLSELELHIQAFSTDTANQAGLIQVGDAGGYHILGYTGGANTNGSANSVNSTGFFLTSQAAQDAATTGDFLCTLRHMGGNVWSFASTGHSSTSGELSNAHGLVTLDTELTQIRLTTTGGSAVFDSGTAYLRYR